MSYADNIPLPPWMGLELVEQVGLEAGANLLGIVDARSVPR